MLFGGLSQCYQLSKVSDMGFVLFMQIWQRLLSGEAYVWWAYVSSLDKQTAVGATLSK